jgi:hypothetical protein
MPHEWRQPTRARIGIPWWPWQARWRTRLGARFLLQFKQPLDKPSQGGIIEQRVPHCSTVERTIVRSARAHGARDQLGAQRIAFAPQEQRGALRQLRVLGAQLRRRQQRGGLASSVGHEGQPPEKSRPFHFPTSQVKSSQVKSSLSLPSPPLLCLTPGRSRADFLFGVRVALICSRSARYFSPTGTCSPRARMSALMTLSPLDGSPSAISIDSRPPLLALPEHIR